jgi:hypothetical protein
LQTKFVQRGEKNKLCSVTFAENVAVDNMETCGRTTQAICDHVHTAAHVLMHAGKTKQERGSVKHNNILYNYISVISC